MESHRATARLFSRQHGLITRKQALALGLTGRAIEVRIKTHEWERVHPGVYRLAGSHRTWQQRILAACLAAGPSSVASHHSAGRLWDLPIRSADIEVTIPENRHVTLARVIVHRSLRLEPADARRREGVPTTSVARTVVDLASVLSAAELESLLDHVLGDRRVSAGEVRRCLERLGTQGRRGAGALANLLAARLTGPHNPASQLEELLLRALINRGLPRPMCQYPIRLPNGRTIRIDFAYPEVRLAIEADSYRYHSSLTDWSRDRTRHNQLIALGWRVLPITFVELRANPNAVADQVAQRLDTL